MTTFYPKINNPYYIVAPRYVQSSAGIRALYLLCHHLNLKGYQAYILVTSKTLPDDGVYDLIAPFITKNIINYHRRKNLCPVVVYPEIISGNPLKSSCVVRYVLNYPGLLGGDKIYHKDEIVFAYSKKLADTVTCHKAEVIYIPACDPDIFYPPQDSADRSGACYYAAKYRAHGFIPQEITNGLFEITRGHPTSPNQVQIADVFRKAEIFYSYEDTALAIEATLCGCPTVFIPSDFLKNGPLAEDEVGADGMAFGTSLESIEHARNTVKFAYRNYKTSVDNFYKDLDNFISITQIAAKKIKNPDPISMFLLKKSYLIELVKLTYSYYKKHGVFGTFAKINNKLAALINLR